MSATNSRVFYQHEQIILSAGPLEAKQRTLAEELKNSDCPTDLGHAGALTSTTSGFPVVITIAPHWATPGLADVQRNANTEKQNF